MSELITEHGPGWTLDQPRNRPTVDPLLVDTWRAGAPFDLTGQAQALYDWATTPEGY